MNSPSNFRCFVLLVVLGVSGCATSDPALWPASPGSPTKDIYVSLDTWHAMIGFHGEFKQGQKNANHESQGSTSSSEPAMFEEWGYAEREWYLEGKQGITGVLRALFWPSEGVVEVAEYDHLWADRTHQPPSELFEFELSEEGYERLRAHLQSTKESSAPVKVLKRSSFYQAADSYHVFHHCHQYVARALNMAGLPISPIWAISRTTLSMQLEEVEDLASRQKNRTPP